jgi:flagellar basal body-associated protein FliL
MFFCIISKSFYFSIQMYDDNRFCSSRAGITTFIIVAVIIIVAGASVGIVFAVIKSSSSSGTGTNNKTNSCM